MEPCWRSQGSLKYGSIRAGFTGNLPGDKNARIVELADIFIAGRLCQPHVIQNKDIDKPGDTLSADMQPEWMDDGSFL